jgi:TonB family protein
MFELAELYRLRLDEPDSALVAYRRVVERDTTRELAPKATYAIGWIYAEAKRDSASARAAFASLVQDYPGTVYAEAAASRLGDGTTADEAARTRFQEAEGLRLAGTDPTAYLPTFERIVSDYPSSSYAVKALYAVAWTYENVLRDAETARRRYQDVAERYVKTALGDLARRKVEAMVVEARADSLRLIAARADSIREAAARADSLRLAARADSLRLAVRADSIWEAAARADSFRLAARAGSLKSLAADSLRSVSRQDSLLEGVRADTPNVPGGAAVSGGADAMQLPQVAQAALLVYPDSLKALPAEAQVSMKVLVGEDGRVKEAIVLHGPDRYHQAALATIRQYTFIPGTREGQPEEMWVEQVVEFLPP